MSPRPAPLLLGLLAVGCAPGTQPPVSMMAIVQNSSGSYAPTQVQLQTLRNIVSMQGDVATFEGNADIVVDANNPALSQPGLTPQQEEQIFLQNKGQSPTASYIQKGSVFWPADFHTWNMVTAYYDFEQAFNYFQARGVPSGLSQDNSGNITCAPSSLCGSTVDYWASFTLVQTSPSPQTDNVLFYSPVYSFLLLPFDQQMTLVPLQMNAGVLAHEYSHRVFNEYVYQGELDPQPIADWVEGNAAQVNLLKAIDEGLADYHAYGASCATPYGCNTRFLEDSFGSAFADARDMAQPDKCMSAGLLTALCTLDTADFISQTDQYQVGTLLAASLYHAGKEAGQEEELQKAVINAYNDTSSGTPGLNQLLYQNLNNGNLGNVVTLGAVANTILLHISDPVLAQATCNEFMNHLQLTFPDICPSGTPNCGCPNTAGGCTDTSCCTSLWTGSGGQNNICVGF